MLKMINKAVLTGFILVFIFSASPLEAGPLRSFGELFPYLSALQKQRVFGRAGLRNTFTINEAPLFTPALNSGIDLMSLVLERNPTQLVEVITVIPYNERPLNILDAYNAMGRIENISNYTYFSTSRNRVIPVFEESTRLENARRNRRIPDPSPATALPSRDTIYFCLDDTFFGKTYLRGDLSLSNYGMTFNITNFAAVWFMLFPVMGAEKFSTILYAEPLEEGMLVYGMAGLDAPQFLIGKMNLINNIDRRITVFISWLRDGFIAIR